MQSEITLLQALGIIQGHNPDKIVIYDSDRMSFRIFSSVDEIRSIFPRCRAKIGEDGVTFLYDGVTYYLVHNEDTKKLIQ